jgi:hypothetical protein
MTDIAYCAEDSKVNLFPPTVVIWHPAHTTKNRMVAAKPKLYNILWYLWKTVLSTVEQGIPNIIFHWNAQHFYEITHFLIIGYCNTQKGLLNNI